MEEVAETFQADPEIQEIPENPATGGPEETLERAQLTDLDPDVTDRRRKRLINLTRTSTRTLAGKMFRKFPMIRLLQARTRRKMERRIKKIAGCPGIYRR